MKKPVSPRPRKPKSGQRISKPAKDEIAGRAWQRMLSGRRLDILNPSPLDIEIEDIAHGLARVSRWNGQTRGKHSFSVAQHCVLVERLLRANAPKLDQKWYLAAVLHDAPEYVIGDLISPFKAAIGADYKQLEARLLAAIYMRFSVPVQLPAQIESTIKRADIAAAYLEAIQLAGFDEDEARKIFGKPRDLPRLVLRGLPPDDAAARLRDQVNKYLRRLAKARA